MSGRLLKIAGVAAVAGGGYFYYTKYSEQPKDVNLKNAGRQADDRIMRLSSKAKEAEQGATVSLVNAKDQIQQTATSLADKAVSSIDSAAASFKDTTTSGVDTAAVDSKSTVSKVKGWFSNK